MTQHERRGNAFSMFTPFFAGAENMMTEFNRSTSPMNQSQRRGRSSREGRVLVVPLPGRCERSATSGAARAVCRAGRLGCNRLQRRRDALAASRRTFVQLALVDLEHDFSGDAHTLAEQFASMTGMLLVVCGNDNDVEEELWARQIGSWLYLPGVDESTNVAPLVRRSSASGRADERSRNVRLACGWRPRANASVSS